MIARLISTSLAMTLLLGGAEACLAVPAQEGASAKQASKPKPMSANVQRGLAYLASQQLADGGWTEGEESPYMRASSHANLKDTANVADTCMAALAFVRAGHQPDNGRYGANVKKAVEFVCRAIGQADANSLYVTDVRNTRVQQKLGPHIDTFLASLLLAEVKGHMPDARGNACVASALGKVLAKIEGSQGANGTWSGGGWAPIHSQALATKALNRARQVGAPVKDLVLERAERAARSNIDNKSGRVGMSGAAGVELYALGANLGAAQDSINTSRLEAGRYRQILKSKSASKDDLANARERLQRYYLAERAQEEALSAVAAKLKDQQFLKGFGCNGGEEFLSYLQISETLLANQSEDWPAWNQTVTKNINHVQAADGSWIGQHCITSRTFCTAAAVMVLSADRAPLPSLARIDHRPRISL